MAHIAIVCSQFHKSLVKKLYQQAVRSLKNSKSPYPVKCYEVPGAGEIPLTAKWAIEKKQALAVLGLGVIIRGQTAHFDFLKDFLQNSLWSLQNQYALPVVFSVLLLENRDQATNRLPRAGEAMQTLLKMLELKHSLKPTPPNKNKPKTNKNSC